MLKERDAVEAALGAWAAGLDLNETPPSIAHWPAADIEQLRGHIRELADVIEGVLGPN